MDWNRVEGNWKQVKGKIKEKWGDLTDDDLDKIAGKRDQLEGKLQERYGLAKDQVKKDVDDWYTALVADHEMRRAAANRWPFLIAGFARTKFRRNAEWLEDADGQVGPDQQ